MMHGSFVLTKCAPVEGTLLRLIKETKITRLRKFLKLNKVHKVLPQHYKSSKTISGERKLSYWLI